MKKLEIELYRYENLVFGKILYQDERLREHGILIEKGGFYIDSYLRPELAGTILFIRGGNKENDNNIFYCHYCDEKTAITICKRIKECVDLINSEEEKQSGVERNI